MSLIKCFECDNEISELALSCPKCGAPIEQIKKSNDFLVRLLMFVVFVVATEIGFYKGSWLIFFGVFFGLFLLLAIPIVGEILGIILACAFGIIGYRIGIIWGQTTGYVFGVFFFFSVLTVIFDCIKNYRIDLEKYR